MARVFHHPLPPELQSKASEMLNARGLKSLHFYRDLMEHPGLFERVEALGSYLRFHGVLPGRIREAAILVAGVSQQNATIWQTHQHTARKAGLSEAEISAIGGGRTLEEPLEDVAQAVRSCIAGEALPQTVFDRLVDAFETKGAVEIVTLAAFYRMMDGLSESFESAAEAVSPLPWAS
jgi:4-carboxymuconolactone decarboxylase/cardiolipin synthase